MLYKKTKLLWREKDFSSPAVKLLELSRLGKSNYKVESYAIEALPAGCVADKNIVNIEAVGEAIRRAVKKAKPRTELAAVAVAGSTVITRTLQMPKGQSKREMEEGVQVESEQYIPYPIEEVRIDFEVMGPNEKNEEQIDVLLAAAKTETVENRVTALEMGGLKVKVVDIELFALENAFGLLANNDPEINSEETIALVEVGATTTTFSVLQNLKIVYTRDQAFGGNQLTEQIQHQYGLSYDEASLAKRSGGLPEDYETQLLDPFRESMAQEISRAMQFYYATGTAGTIAHTVIGGGCASIPGVVEQISNKVGGHVTLANPFASMSVSNNVAKKSLMNDAPALMIACGLALRSFD